ncbi:spermidine synthase [Fredinandcohnia sp. 179-A 10B2 NHS]|uniref:spermidine synthase n=1 Tax=Fredinandcohnia sp. 179-A 10B2 NHS TaxID=3235176 RepID=UPI0039A1CB8E
MSYSNKNEGLNRQVNSSGSRVIFKTTSSFQDIYVVEKSEYEGVHGNFRLLKFTPDAVQGVKKMDDPDFLVLPYSRTIVELINYYGSSCKKGFIIGHGIGTISSYYYEKYLVTAEIDPLVVEVSKKYFGHSGNNVEVGDGLEILSTLQLQSQDIILLDAYSSNGVPQHLITKEFFALTNEKLSHNGILLINYIGTIKNDKNLYKIYSRIKAIYPYAKLFASDPKKASNQNLFLVASRTVLEEFSPNEASAIYL